MEDVSRIDELIDLLQSKDYTVRRRAAIELGAIGNAPQNPSLIASRVSDDLTGTQTYYEENES